MNVVFAPESVAAVSYKIRPAFPSQPASIWYTLSTADLSQEFRLMRFKNSAFLHHILVAEIPTVLQADLYAVPALVRAFIVVIGRMMQLPTLPVAVLGGAVCFGFRFLAIRYDWHLPRASQSDQVTSDAHHPNDEAGAKTKGRRIAPSVDNDDAEP